MDFSPPAYRSPLPPLAEAIDHADQGTWAPPRGPARLSGRVYARLVLPARWVVRLLDAVLARPGRLVVAGLLVWLLTRIPGASEITTGVLAILGWPLVALWWLLTL